MIISLDKKRSSYSYYDIEKVIKKQRVRFYSYKIEYDENDNVKITEQIFNAVPGIKESGWTFDDYKQAL
jgi:hypothetical protein